MNARIALGLLSVVACAGSATLASADVTPAPSSPAHAATTKLSSLPEVTIPAEKTMILRIPKQIPKTEKVDGFFIREPQYIREAKKAKPKAKGRKMRAEEMAYAQVTESEAAMDTLENSSTPVFTTCFSEGGGGPLMKPGEVEWQSSMQYMASIYYTPKPIVDQDYVVPPVHLLRSEKLDLSDAAKPKLVVTVAFVDAETHGARLLSRESHALTKMFSGPGDLVVYGAHQGKKLEVVVTGALNHNYTLQQADGNFGSASCEHATATLAADDVGTGEMIAFLQDVSLGKAAPEPEDSERGSSERIRVRSLRFTASLALLSKDPEPVLSFSTRWVDKERVESR